MRYSLFLDNILARKSKVKALRYLSGYKPEASVREISRAIGISHPNTSIALKELEAEGALKSVRVGQSTIYSLNLGHYIVEKIIKPAFEKEREAKNELISRIKKNIGISFESIILFGSVRRGKEKPLSDIDLAIVINDREDPVKLEESIAALNPSVAEEFGNTLSPVIFSKSGFVKKIKDNDGLVREIVKNGEVIAGKLISELL
ncbi:MAG: nucleotidyltransferase domain-containing protein [Patescibacteria group bacterium]|jgi:predicted nucleotidyltransferase